MKNRRIFVKPENFGEEKVETLGQVANKNLKMRQAARPWRSDALERLVSILDWVLEGGFLGLLGLSR